MASWPKISHTLAQARPYLCVSIFCKRHHCSSRSVFQKCCLHNRINTHQKWEYTRARIVCTCLILLKKCDCTESSSTRRRGSACIGSLKCTTSCQGNVWESLVVVLWSEGFCFLSLATTCWSTCTPIGRCLQDQCQCANPKKSQQLDSLHTS